MFIKLTTGRQPMEFYICTGIKSIPLKENVP
jgi:hypothetical protein